MSITRPCSCLNAQCPNCGGRHEVVVLDADNRIRLQPARVGERSGQLWVIEEGLHPGLRVVVEGIQKARDGMTVMPTNYVS